MKNLDVVELVTVGVAAGGGTGQQRDGDPLRRSLVGRRVDALAAIDLVAAVAAGQHVVAFHAPQQVGLIVPGELVVIPRAGQVLDIDQRIALGVTARIPAAEQHKGCERDVHALLRAVIGGHISAVAAIERVGADAAVEIIVVVAAVELVVAVLAPQEVVVVAAVELVLAPAALEPVVAVAAEELVSAVVAEEVVAAAKAVNRVVPITAIDLVVARGDAVGCIENVRARRSSDVGHGPTLSSSRLSARAFARAAVLPVGARFRR